MSEYDVNIFLSTKKYQKQSKLCVPKDINMPTKCYQSNTVALPISLENNSTLSGTAAIMEQFVKEFNLPTASNVEGIPFDSISKTFCLQKARELCEFMMMVNIHKEGKNDLNLSCLKLKDKLTVTLNATWKIIKTIVTQMKMMK